MADLALFYIVAGVSLRWIASAAAAGPSSLVVWLLALTCFYLPLVVALVELSSRYPQEGGLYLWTKQAFGPFAGFIAGWSYFTSNLPYFPSIFYFDAGNALYLFGPGVQALRDSPAYFMSFALVALAGITLLNLVGLRIAKVMHNIGAAGMWLPAGIVIVIGLVAWSRFGSATRFTAATMTPSLDLTHMIFWSGLLFAMAGPEAASFMSGEIREPRRTIPRALPIAGVVVVLCYIVGTACVLLAVPPEGVNSLQGLVQAGAAGAAKLRAGWIVPILALLITVGNLGAASAYLAACARIPFVVGVDRMLPPAFGRIHPRWGTPWTALLVQAGLGAVFVVLGQAGTGVKGAYDVLVSMTIIALFIPFALMFASLIALQREPAGPEVQRLPGGRFTSILAGAVGLATTLLGIVLAAFPAADEANKPLAVAKIVGATAVLLAAGTTVYLLGRRGLRAQGGVG